MVAKSGFDSLFTDILIFILMITFFRTLSETDKPFYRPIETALERIKSGESKAKVEAVRNESSKDERNKLKKLLPAVCFSGQFAERNASSIIEHSGFICIDFDGFEDEFSLAIYRHQLVNDKYSFAVFTSPSGNGLKVLVKIPKEIENHKKYFIALQEYYNVPEFDKSCKDISRICYESYDPELFHNPLSEEWTILPAIKEPKPIQYENTIRLEDQSEIVRRLLLWWNKNFGMAEGAKNNNLFILASTLNTFGVERNEAMSIVLSFDEGGKEEEITKIFNSAYRNTQDHGTKFFEDLDKLDEIKKLSMSGMPVEKIAEVVKPISIEKVKEVVKEIKEKTVNEYWARDSKGKIKHVNHLFKWDLENKGYFKYVPEGATGYIFVKFLENIMFDANEDDIKTETLEELIDMEDLSVFNYFSETTKLFKADYLTMLKKIEPKSLQDDKHTSYLYYLNCAVKITKDKIQTIPYEELDGFVWENQKIRRNFSLSGYEDCVYEKFIHNISNKDRAIMDSMESTIGYLMHGYKPATCPAVILNDEMISDNPEGGTGKGIYCKALSYMRNQVVIDGKSFNPNGSFPYQLVQVSTQLLLFDDVNRNMPFEKLFSVITEGMTLEKKNKDAITIPFERSPKIIITTNYAIRGSGNSHERRKWEVELAQHYNKDWTPEDEFGHVMFKDWNESEWLKFDNYMIANLQKYLSRGLIQGKFKNLKERKLVADTNMDFYEWARDKDNRMTKLGPKSIIQDMFNEFTIDNPDFGIRGKYSIPVVKFTRWLDSYGEFMFGTKPLHLRDGNIKMIEFIRKLEEQTKIF